ncbi:hypothetical protein PIB30_037775 [Stylosanthes scabra]|uniref:Uncharacterized protein n=1 Tax=Stylosanthes scabra TaxID=79078 RepID=A0ABU6WDS3_9FABA|nr:hypothetical protein [Stylosanthes scabra]
MKKTKNNPVDRFRHSKPRFNEPPKPEFRNTKDSGCRKRTKSLSPEKDSHRSFRLEDSCTQLQSEKKIKTGAKDPKTSEYAFFKKLKKDAGLRFNSHPVQNDDSLPKEPEQTEHSRERNDDIWIRSKGFNALRTVEGMSTVTDDKIFSTPDGKNNPDFHSPSGIQKISQGCSDTFKPQALFFHEGNQNVQGNIFSRKRQKLRQCIADTLFPNNKEMFSLKGHDDIVSMLLSRLFPVRIEENKYEGRNQWKEVDTTGYYFPDSKESDLYKGLDQMPSRKLVEQSSSDFSDKLLSPMLLSSDERITTHHAFPTPNSHMFQLPYSATEPEYKLDRIPSFSFKHDTTLGFPYSEGTNVAGYGLLDSEKPDVQFKEHNQIPDTRLLELEPYPCIRDYLMPPIFLGSNDRIFPKDFPTSHSNKFRRPCNIAEPEEKFNIIPSFSAKYDSAFGFSYNEEPDAVRYGLLDFQKSDFQLNYQIPEPRLLEFKPKPCIRDHLSPIFVRSNTKSIPHDFPTSHSHTFQPLYTMKKHGCDLGRVPSFSVKTDVTHKYLLNDQEHDTFALNHYKEKGKLKRDPIPLLLENGFDCPVDEINLPIAYNSPKPDLVPALSTLGKGEKQMLMNILGECHFSPSSLLLDKPQNITSILDSGLFRCQEFRFKEGDMDSNFNDDALAISHNKRHFTLSADCKNDINSHDQDSVLLQPYEHFIRQTAYNSYHHRHSDAESWLSSSFNSISGQKLGLSLTSSHSTCRGSNSSNFELPQRESMSSPFQISDNSEPEMDGENHREVLYRFRHSLIEICNSSFLQMSMQRENERPFTLHRNDFINEQTGYDPLESKHFLGGS